jgi:prepilin-type N-terminal cleavage/methylation domain-containing protein
MKQRGFTLVEIMIVVLIIGILLTIAVPGWMKMRRTTHEKACWSGLRMIDDAKQQWSMDTNQETGATPTEADLSPEYIKTWPTCDGGGTITIGSNMQNASHSVWGQAP